MIATESKYTVQALALAAVASLAVGAVVGYASAPAQAGTQLYAPTAVRPVMRTTPAMAHHADMQVAAPETPAAEALTTAETGFADEHVAEVQSFNLEDLESDLEEAGTVVSQLSSLVMPAVALFGALFAGAMLRKPAQAAGEAVKDMEMGADLETPFSRRGLLQFAAAALPLAASSPAFAAKSGGRMGGSNFRKAPPSPTPRGGPAPRSAVPPLRSGPNITINNFSGPRLGAAPYAYGGYAGGMGYGFTGFSSGELLALNAIQLAEMFAREQRRQAFYRQQLEQQRQMGRDEAEIAQLQRQLAEQDFKMQQLQEAMQRN